MISIKPIGLRIFYHQIRFTGGFDFPLLGHNCIDNSEFL